MMFLHVLIERTITKVLVGTDAFIAHRFMVSVTHTIALSHSLPLSQRSQRQGFGFGSALIDLKGRTILFLRHLECACWVKFAYEAHLLMQATSIFK